MKDSTTAVPTFELVIGWVMILGICFSSLLVLIGGIRYVFHQSHHLVHYQQFLGEPISLRSTIGILKGSTQFSGKAIIQLGIWCLVATQVVRVLLTGIFFGLERDKWFAWISFIIAGVLIYSIV